MIALSLLLVSAIGIVSAAQDQCSHLNFEPEPYYNELVGHDETYGVIFKGYLQSQGRIGLSYVPLNFSEVQFTPAVKGSNLRHMKLVGPCATINIDLKVDVGPSMYNLTGIANTVELQGKVIEVNQEFLWSQTVKVNAGVTRNFKCDIIDLGKVDGAQSLIFMERFGLIFESKNVSKEHGNIAAVGYGAKW